MLWIAFGLASAAAGTVGSIVSEKSHADGRTMANWFRIISVALCLPFIGYLSLPTAWEYWALALISAAVMGVNDVVLFNAMKSIGAGATSRFRRTSILITFILWLVVSPSLLYHYIENPVVGLSVLTIHILAVYFALRLKNHDSSWAGLKMLWFPILASSVGPILSKLSFEYADNNIQGVFSYIFIQSTAVMLGYGLYALVRNGTANALPALASLTRDGMWRPAIAAAFAFTIGLFFKHYGYSLVENPAYISVLLLTDTLCLLAYHKLFGIKDKTDIASGMGIVACAAALILLQIFFE